MKSVNKEIFDIVIINGRVMDPLTRTDVVAHVGIKNGKIKSIVTTDEDLRGEREVDATGLVVAPGFINMHSHGSGTGKGSAFIAGDGITTDITGNCGDSGTIPDDPDLGSSYPLKTWFSRLEEKGLIINIASYAGHNTLRCHAGLDPYTPANNKQLLMIIGMSKKDIEEGAVGISLGPFDGPGATFEEMVAVSREAVKLGGGASIHIRHSDPANDIKAIEEAIGVARKTRIPLVISHMGPLLGHNHSGAALELIQEAREAGLKLATTCQPWDSFQLNFMSPIFDIPLKTLFEIFCGTKISDLLNYTDIVIDGKTVIRAGEKYKNIEQFNYIRKKVKAGNIPDPYVIGLNVYKHYKIFLWYCYPFTMLMNDTSDTDMDYKTLYHPKNTGSFSRFLGHYVREQGACDLMSALAKTSSLAALWLGLKKKGRVQVGCDADLTLFDPLKIASRATYTKPDKSPAGIPHVIVNGVFVIYNGKYTGERPGKVIRRSWKVPGDVLVPPVLANYDIKKLSE